MKYDTQVERLTEDEQLAERFTRRETEPQRRARIKSQHVDPATATALRMFFAR